MVRFPSEEWIKLFKDKLNENTGYAKIAKEWEGDFLFIIANQRTGDNFALFNKTV